MRYTRNEKTGIVILAAITLSGMSTVFGFFMEGVQPTCDFEISQATMQLYDQCVQPYDYWNSFFWYSLGALIIAIIILALFVAIVAKIKPSHAKVERTITPLPV